MEARTDFRKKPTTGCQVQASRIRRKRLWGNPFPLNLKNRQQPVKNPLRGGQPLGNARSVVFLGCKATAYAREWSRRRGTLSRSPLRLIEGRGGVASQS